MKILPLVIAPNPLLKQVSKSVDKVDDELRKFMDDMLQTMYAEEGLGLAAVQVGVLKRILVMDVDYEKDDHHHHDHQGCSGVHVHNTNPLFLVNPKIIDQSKDESTYNEGCLSFPGARAQVTRPESVKVKFLDYYGKEKIIEMDGILATCVQHEIDHLNGITFVDHISKLKRDVIINKMKKIATKT